MGAAKATLVLEGRPLVDYPLAALAEAGLEAVVVAKRDSPLPDLDVPVWREPDEPAHPLTGITTALEQADGRALVVVACDMPFTSPRLLSYLAELDARLAVPLAGGRLHPLIGRYEPSVLAQLVSALGERLPVQRAVSELDPRLIDEQSLEAFGDPDRLLFNVNRPADLERARELLAGKG